MNFAILPGFSPSQSLGLKQYPNAFPIETVSLGGEGARSGLFGMGAGVRKPVREASVVLAGATSMDLQPRLFRLASMGKVLDVVKIFIAQRPDKSERSGTAYMVFTFQNVAISAASAKVGTSWFGMSFASYAFSTETVQ